MHDSCAPLRLENARAVVVLQTDTPRLVNMDLRMQAKKQLTRTCDDLTATVVARRQMLNNGANLSVAPERQRNQRAQEVLRNKMRGASNETYTKVRKTLHQIVRLIRIACGLRAKYAPRVRPSIESQAVDHDKTKLQDGAYAVV